jgi:signal transduction histidine kinase
MGASGRALLQAQKIEALGQLVGGVAHDFNNLLMAIIGNLDLLSKKLGEDARLHRLLDGAMEGARRGATLTQRLLAFARKQELKAQATDVRSLVEDMIGLIDRSVGPMVRIELPPKTKCRSSTSTRTSSKWLCSISP